MAVAAILLLSVSVRPLGAVLAVALGAALAAMGVPGVRFWRACAIGAIIGALAGIVFVWALRQPLPLWPTVPPML